MKKVSQKVKEALETISAAYGIPMETQGNVIHGEAILIRGLIAELELAQWKVKRAKRRMKKHELNCSVKCNCKWLKQIE